MSDPLFTATGLNLSFGGVKAVRDVSFEIQPGEVFSIIGPNGAGKTTILNLISRLYDVEDGGRMTFDGRDITSIAPYEVAQAGIARTFQNTELFEHDTVLKNLLLGNQGNAVTRNLAIFDCFEQLPNSILMAQQSDGNLCPHGRRCDGQLFDENLTGFLRWNLAKNTNDVFANRDRLPNRKIPLEQIKPFVIHFSGPRHQFKSTFECGITRSLSDNPTRGKIQ